MGRVTFRVGGDRIGGSGPGQGSRSAEASSPKHPFVGCTSLLRLSRFVPAIYIYIADTDLRSPIGLAGALLGEKDSLIPLWPPAASSAA